MPLNAQSSEIVYLIKSTSLARAEFRRDVRVIRATNYKALSPFIITYYINAKLVMRKRSTLSHGLRDMKKL